MNYMKNNQRASSVSCAHNQRCWFRYINLIIVALLMTTTFPNAVDAKIILTFEPGVPDNVKVTIRQGIQQAEHFYKDNFGVTLQKDLEIVLALDKASYTKVLQRVCKYSQETAEKKAATSGGISCCCGIAIPVTKHLDTMFFVAIHELTHKYQGQASPGNRAQDIMWLMEGGATATAGYIADKYGVESLSDLYKEYLGRQKGKRITPLRDLRSSKGHNMAREKYPGGPVYAKESLAALELAKRKGVKSLYNFFLNLKKDKDSTRVFEMTFGIKLDTYEKEFEKELEKMLNLTPSSPSTDPLGKIWQETEDKGWRGVFTRRGDSNIFDAIWTRKKAEKVTGVLMMHRLGYKVLIESHQQSNGLKWDYEGTISEDSRKVSGTFWPTGSPGKTLQWEAIIER